MADGQANNATTEARKVVQPTPEAYAELQQAFDHFNAALFESSLPPCLITLQREKRTMGYFSAARFVRRTGEQTDEIAMNPGFFGVRTIEDSLSTLVHEMAHAWQHHFGEPGRARYHNLQWAEKMVALGLMPSDTGQPGGRRVGEHMSHYVIEGGPFATSCADLLTREFTLSWLDRFPPARPQANAPQPKVEPAPDPDPKTPKPAPPPRKPADEAAVLALDNTAKLLVLPSHGAVNRSNRVKYRCPYCLAQAWGKPGLHLLCGNPDCTAAPFVACEPQSSDHT